MTEEKQNKELGTFFSAKEIAGKVFLPMYDSLHEEQREADGRKFTSIGLGGFLFGESEEEVENSFEAKKGLKQELKERRDEIQAESTPKKKRRKEKEIIVNYMKENYGKEYKGLNWSETQKEFFGKYVKRFEPLRVVAKEKGDNTYYNIYPVDTDFYTAVENGEEVTEREVKKKVDLNNFQSKVADLIADTLDELKNKAIDQENKVKDEEKELFREAISISRNY